MICVNLTWHSIEIDGLPKDIFNDEQVLVSYEDGVCEARYKDKKFYTPGMIYSELNGVTHWAFMPENVNNA